MSSISAASLFSKGFVSAELVWTGNTLHTLAHLLGVKPKLIHIVNRCKITQGGYAVGDEPVVVSWEDGNTRGFGLWADATNIKIIMGSLGQMAMHNTTGGNFTSATASWRLIVRAFA